MTLTFDPQFQITNAFLKALKNEPERFYWYKSQPKMKYGRPQTNRDNSQKMRNISEPIPALKLKQRQINYYLQNIPLPECMYGGIKGRNNIKNAEVHSENKYFLTIDLKDFFTNITNYQVYETLVDYGFAVPDARIITKLTTIKGALPQGAPTSTPLANLTFASTALVIEKFCTANGISFTIFVDDLTFSSKKNFKFLTSQILKLIKKGGFVTNKQKIHYRRGNCEVTGLLVKNGKMHLEKEMLKHIDKPQIKAYFDKVEKHNAHRVTSTIRSL